MKVLIVNKKDISGGAAKAAYRLHKGLIQSGVDSSMLVMEKQSNDDTVIPTPKGILTKYRQKIDNIPAKFYSIDKHHVFSSGITKVGFLRLINAINPDIVHLHWVPRGFVSIESLEKIKQPIVWSLHDMWPFTGGCHYDDGCGKYATGCGACPILKSTKEYDFIKWIYNRKMKSFSAKENYKIVGLSKWMADMAASSLLFDRSKVINLPNGLDMKLFKPADKIDTKKFFGISPEKRVILFGAMDATSDIRKGYDYLTGALSRIPDNSVELLIFGSKSGNTPFKQKATYVGNISDEAELIKLYVAADLTVVPSLQENLSNVIVESLACGTPVVGFNIGGNRDMIEHKVNGYLAKPLDVEDLAAGIEWIIEDPTRTMALGEKAREIALDRFEIGKVAAKYIDIYNQLINTK